ncbi:hydroxymethylglutaryl-CoA reductase, degradative [Tetragenococcus osmophilus]|uniref:acetyl-CoA C-acetyltransferase n=1 Tax=Tetragenococcus osmophilus TaxID=526944 RepID=A0AA37XKK9_9ENTE|nr:hydroxymethylglutaryl-CoA reductase, degradative [Tetragenococcus osmophilus]AYW48305.1 hydroxymethylglutaryl-CoA reductase, degradative [Tetragenococcus osmophilus]GMA54113.1 hydroxymethylglutaryl-CoA reductase, degradative [Alicyclobacillus contaminans]GMA72000.1 hydroxymethylglutaryl-CoA reductase, degradative [Tetragenococcus osmophilus]
MEEVVIIDALRTPVGKYQGRLSQLSAVELGTAVTQKLIEKNKIATTALKQIIFGNVLQAGSGQNPARQITLNSGLSTSVYASTVNEVCGSGMKAIFLATQALRLNEAEVVLAGGTESMSQAPHLTHYDQQKDTYSQPKPAMIADGLTDVFSGQHMGFTAENVAEKYNISRKMQDAFALQSHQKAAYAQDNGYFANEMLPIGLEDDTVDQDEGVRKNTSTEKLAKLNPVFKQKGSVTAGNASTINDGAAAVMLARKSFALENDLSYLAALKDTTEVGIDPKIMGVSPVKAISELLERNELNTEDIDLFEINEAFASSSIAVQQELNIPEEKINLCGSGISIGHAIGATGARIMTTACHQLNRINGRYAIVSLCVGGGLGLAALIERPQETKSSRFYELSRQERLDQLVSQQKITTQMKNELNQNSLSEKIASNLIENQISETAIPMGVVENIKVNQKEYLVPLATEEPSVIAACNNGAQLVKKRGGFAATMAKKEIRGQIVFMNVQDKEEIIRQIKENQSLIMEEAKQAYPSIVKRGGGLKDIEIRDFAEDSSFLSVDLIVDTQDAMGANMLNTMLEAVATLFRQWFSEEILFSILSNYATEAVVSANCYVSFTDLGKGDAVKGEQIAKKISAASNFAQIDPYRAVTHNKGVMNGVNAVVLATGNDTRSVNSAIHAYAARNGKYQGLSQWEIDKGYLKGSIELPLAVATAGGATKVLPKAQVALQILEVNDAKELAEVIAAVGLAQNLAAIKALVTEGIQKGHMALQARSLALNAGAKASEVQKVANRLKKKQMNEENARKILQELRNK